MALNFGLFLLLFMLVQIFSFDPYQDLNRELKQIQSSRNLMGVQLEITKNSRPIYHINIGLRDNLKPIQNETMFGVASLSKSISASAIMLLVEQKKLTLNQSLSSILGFQLINPYFPDSIITIQMALSHQSSLVQCEPYYSNFLQKTYFPQSGEQVPSIKQILTEGGKFYNKCLFSNRFAPGTHFEYVNLNYGLMGTTIEMITGTRFDIFMKQRILKYISSDLSQLATFNPATILNSSHLGGAFEGENGKWVPTYDFYPDGVIHEKNLTGYKIGLNGVVFSPQAGMRASVTHLSNYVFMLANKGLTKQGVRVLSQKSVEQMLKPRYQFHGRNSRAENDYNLYGFGIYTTSYRSYDNVIPHEIVKGHLGEDHGMISAFYFWKNYTLTYIINGALYGYQDSIETFYQVERLLIMAAVTNFIKRAG